MRCRRSAVSSSCTSPAQLWCLCGLNSYSLHVLGLPTSFFCSSDVRDGWCSQPLASTSGCTHRTTTSPSQRRCMASPCSCTCMWQVTLTLGLHCLAQLIDARSNAGRLPVFHWHLMLQVWSTEARLTTSQPGFYCYTISGVLGEAVASTLDGAALMIAAGAGSLAAGVPITVMPAPLLAAGGLAMYLDTSALRDYLLFVAGALGTGVPFPQQRLWTKMASSCASVLDQPCCTALRPWSPSGSKVFNRHTKPVVCMLPPSAGSRGTADGVCSPRCAAIWFVVHHFWFLDVKVGGLPVRGLCQLLLAALAPAVLLPGLIRSGASKTLVNTLMLLQVCHGKHAAYLPGIVC